MLFSFTVTQEPSLTSQAGGHGLFLLLNVACSFLFYSFIFVCFLKQYVSRMNTSLSLAGKKGARRGNVRAVIHCNTLGETASNFYSIDPP